MLKGQVRVFFRLTGGTVLTWLAAGAFAACALVFIELIISLQVANLLVMLGLVDKAMQLPFGLGRIAGSLSAFVAIFICLGILRGFFYFLIAHSANFAHEAMLNRLRLLAFRESFCSDRKMISLSTLTALLSEHFPRATLFCLYLANLIPSSIQALFLGALLLKSSIRLTALAALALTFVGLLVHFVNIYVRRIVASNPAMGENMIQRMIRMSQNKYLLKALRTMEREHHQLVLTSLRFASSIVRSNALGNFAGNVPATFGLITLMLLVSDQLKHPELSGMAFLSFLYLFLRMVQSLSSSSVAYGAMNSQYPAFKRVATYVSGFSDREFSEAIAPSNRLSAFGLRRNVEAFAAGAAEKSISSSGQSENLIPSIHFEGVLFRYNPGGPSVLDGFNLDIRPGEACAIMGASGSGKSTILALLLGMLKPNEGEITLGGKTPHDFFSDRNLKLGFVGAEPYLIEGTVRENLLYGVRDQNISDAELRSVLNRAQLGELVAANGNFLEYHLSESGEGLSTGQKQRLMFARALLAKPTLLVLDEASANLDEKTESLLAAEIQKLSGYCTTIIITHRSGFVSWVEKKIQLTSTLEQSDHVSI